MEAARLERPRRATERTRLTGTAGPPPLNEHAERFRRERLRPAVAEERPGERKSQLLRDEREERRVGEVLDAGVCTARCGHGAGEIERLPELEAERPAAREDVRDAIGLVGAAVAELGTVHDDGVVEER